MRPAARARSQRRAELVARIASEREAAVRGWHTCHEHLATLQERVLMLRGLSRSPLFYIATAATTWLVGRQRGLAILKRALRNLRA